MSSSAHAKTVCGRIVALLVSPRVGTLAVCIVVVLNLGIDPDQEITLVPYPRPRSFFEALNSEFSVRSMLSSWLVSPADRLRAAETLPMRLFRPGEPLALMPPPLLPSLSSTR